MSRNSNGSIDFDVRLNNEQLRADAAAAMAAIRDVGDSTVSEGGKMDDALKRVGNTIATVFTIQQAQTFVQKVVEVRGEIESLEISFKTLLGSESKAMSLMNEIKTFAVETPMNMGDLAKGAQTLLGFNVEAEKVMPILRQIGDISMGSADKFNSLVLSFSQMSATGKLMGQDLNQMINAGFNPLLSLSKMTGQSIAQLKDEMSAGAISAEMVAEAFAAAAGEGGMFYGMLEQQSKGVQGSLANLQGAIDDMYNEIGQGSQGVITGVADVATSVVQNYKAVGEALAVVIGTYGVYKAAVMTHAAVSVAAAKGEMAALSALLPVKKASADADVLAAVAAGRLSAATGEKLIALRAEVAARHGSLIAAKEAAVAELASARASKLAALQKIQGVTGIKASLAARQAEYVQIMATGNAQLLEAKRVEILSLKRELDTARLAKHTAAQRMLEAQKKVNIATTELDTFTTQRNAAATGLLTKMKLGLVAAMAKLKAAMATNAYAIALAAVAALGYGIYKLITYQTDAEKAQKELNKTLKEGEQAAASEGIQIEIMFNRLKNAKEGTEAWDAARKAIMSKYGEYLKSLGDEKTALRDIARAYQVVAKEAKKAAVAGLVEKATSQAADTLATARDTQYEAIEKLVKEKFKDEVAFNDAMDKLRPVILSGEEITEEVQKIIDKFRKTVSVGYLGKSAIVVSNEVQTELDKLKVSEQAFEKTMSSLEEKYGKAKIKPPDISALPLERLREELAKTKEAMDSFYVLPYFKQALQAQSDRIQSEIEAREVEFKSIGQQREEARKELAQLEAEKSALMKGQTKSNEYTAAIEEKNKKIAAAQKKLNLLLYGTETAPREDSGKPKKSTAELKVEADKLSKERGRAYEDSAYKEERARLEAQEDGFVKELALMELNHRMKITEINRQADDTLKTLREGARKEWEARNPEWKKKGLKFEDSDLYKEVNSPDNQINKDAKALLINENKLYEKSVEELRKKLIGQYNDHAAQRLAIEKKYNDDIAALRQQRIEAEKVGNTELVGQLDRAIVKAIAEKEKQLSEMDANFVEKTKLWKIFFSNVEKISLTETRRIGEELREMILKITDPEVKEKLLKMLDEVGKKAEENANTIERMFGNSKGAGILNLLFGEGDLKSKIQDFSTIFKGSEKSGSSSGSDFASMFKGAEKSSGAIAKNAGKASSAMGKAGGGAAGALAVIDLIIKNIHGAIEGISEITEYLKEYEQTVNGQVSESTHQFGEKLKVLSEFDAKAASGWEKFKSGNFLGAITDNIIAWHGLINSGKRSYAEWNKAIKDSLTQQFLGEIEINRLYRERYEWAKKLGESNIDHTKRTNKELKKQTADNEDEQFALWQKLMREGQYKSADYIQKKDFHGIDWLAKDEHVVKWSSLVGKTWDEIERMAAQGLLSEEGMKFYEQLAAAREEGEELAKMQEDARRKAMEWATGTTADSITSGIVDGFKEGKRSAADFADTFEDLMQGAIASALELAADAEVQKFYDEFAKLSESGGELTQSEGAQLEAMWNGIMGRLKDKANQLEQISGVKLGEASREASQKGFASMSQDSADELNGRFTALQALTSEINSSVKSLLSNSAAALKHLAGIENNTQSLSRLATIESDISLIKTGINDMNLKGLLIRK
jgi:tape measure domain-containing protein